MSGLSPVFGLRASSQATWYNVHLQPLRCSNCSELRLLWHQFHAAALLASLLCCAALLGRKVKQVWRGLLRRPMFRLQTKPLHRRRELCAMQCCRDHSNRQHQYGLQGWRQHTAVPCAVLVFDAKSRHLPWRWWRDCHHRRCWLAAQIMAYCVSEAHA